MFRIKLTGRVRKDGAKDERNDGRRQHGKGRRIEV